MPAPEIIHTLVAKFEQNREAYRSGKYNEARLRQEFLDKFFEALGWDVYNRSDYAPENCEVVIEDSLEIEGSSKAPDYVFRMGHERKFFVEAKKPAVDIKYDIHPAYQLRRYAWNAHMPLSILTDFEEFSIYNCKSKPDPKDSAATSRDKFYHYTEYIDKWDEIAAIFSREAVWKGSFDKFAAESKGKKGTTEVDDEILKDIEKWRKLLALNLTLRNQSIKDEEQLNYAVQMTIDRILFLRICEDRCIEPDEQLKTLASTPGIYPRLVELFRRADTKYNSGLFHLHPEKGETTSADTFTPSLTIDDRVLKEIISDIYYPCPYIFKEIPVEILGQVYEQFLGKVIRLTPGHTAKIEEKPEVRKAGGVYYTPTYIVDYIVQNTVGELLKDKTPEQASTLKIVDPACGSGSFLLGAFKYLLNWHYQYYTANQPELLAKRKNAPIFPVGGGWRLTTAEKKRILTNNLYGVDIDPQAVEVTKLSLLLKVLEEESGQLTLGFERVLPDLGRNIQCGNSLIAWDYFSGQLTIDEEERKRINPFDWQRAFPQAFIQGGFDAVIGNPPYIPIESMTSLERAYYIKNNPEVERKFDSSPVFILQGMKKLNESGLLGFISSQTWQTGENFTKLRNTLLKGFGIKKLINLPFDVFPEAYVDTGIYIFSKAKSEEYLIFRFPKKQKISSLEDINFETIPSEKIIPPFYKLIFESSADNILLKITSKKDTKCLGEITFSTQGLAGNMFSRVQQPASTNLMPFLEKGQVHRYELIKVLTSMVDMSDKLSLIKFYEAKPKILIRRVISRQDRLLATYSDEQLVTKKDINPFLFTGDEWNPKFVLGIINSKLVSYIYMNSSSIATKDDFRQTTLAELRRLPIIIFNRTQKSHNQLVTLVDRMLDLHKRTPATPQEQERLARDIAATDRQIDQLVYQLYDLTPAEIAIVEST